MKSLFNCFALGIILSVIFSAGNSPADSSRTNVRAASVKVFPASTFSAEVRNAHFGFKSSRESAQRDWDCQIVGQVRDARGPVAGVKVTLEGPTRASGITDRNGEYSFKNLPPGTYRIKFFSATGRFLRQADRIFLRSSLNPDGERMGEKRRLNISLSSSPSPTPRPSPPATPTPSPSATRTPLSSPSPRLSVQPSPSGNSNQDHTNTNTNVNTNTSVNTNTNTNANANANANGNANTSSSLDAQIEDLVKGKIVYNIPPVMRLGATSVIKVGIAKTITEDVAARIESEENTTVGDLKVNDTMDVDLISEKAGAFEILRQQPRAEIPGWQVIGGDTASEWIFNVTPRQSGTHKLRLVASVRLNDPQTQNQPKTFKVYENDISVSTDYFYHVTEFIKGYWQFLLTTLLLPAGAIGWRFLKGRRTATKNDE